VSTARGLVLLLGTLIFANLLANRIVPDRHVVVGVALTIALLGIARLSALSFAELGLAVEDAAAGLRWGGAAAGVVVAAYALAVVVPAFREGLGDSAAPTLGTGLLTAFVLIPIATVIPEELAFRGVLLALLLRDNSPRRATVLSSALFGLWHVLPALALGPANTAVVDVIGGGVVGTTLRVIGTVLLTGAVGLLFCWLRIRSGSLLAPILLHGAINGIGVLALIAFGSGS
jgi:membrane protease YdiL (CAAX protease family)